MIIVSLSSPPLHTHTYIGRRDLIPNPIHIPDGALAGVRKSISPRIFKKEGELRCPWRRLPPSKFLVTPWTEFHSRARTRHCVAATIPGFVICLPPSSLLHPLPQPSRGKNGVRNATWLVDILSCPCFTSVISATLKLCHGLRGFVVNHYLPLSDCRLRYTVDAWLSAASWVTNISC